MSTIETILSRAMSDQDFAMLLFAKPEQALAGYKLTTNEFETLKNLSAAEFEALSADDRRSFVTFQLGLSVPDSPEKTMDLNFNAVSKLQDFH